MNPSPLTLPPPPISPLLLPLHFPLALPPSLPSPPPLTPLLSLPFASWRRLRLLLPALIPCLLIQLFPQSFILSFLPQFIFPLLFLLQLIQAFPAPGQFPQVFLLESIFCRHSILASPRLPLIIRFWVPHWLYFPQPGPQRVSTQVKQFSVPK